MSITWMLVKWILCLQISGLDCLRKCHNLIERMQCCMLIHQFFIIGILGTASEEDGPDVEVYIEVSYKNRGKHPFVCRNRYQIHIAT